MRRFLWLPVVIILAIFSTGARKGLNSSVYEWEKIPVKKSAHGEVRNFFKSPTRSLDMFEIRSVTLFPDKERWNLKVPDTTDLLIIIKEGIADIRINAEQKTMGEGSIIVAGSDAEINILGHNKSNFVFYLISFKPMESTSKTGTSLKLAPLFIDWKNVEFKPSENGGRRNIMQQKTSVLKELEIHVTSLKEGLPSHAAHSHPDEEDNTRQERLC